MTDFDYLGRLHPDQQFAGDSDRGEIEIVQDVVGRTEACDELSRRFSELGLELAASPFGFVFEDDRIAVIRDAVSFPSGHKGAFLRIMSRNQFDSRASGHAVAVLPLVADELILVRQFRHATRRWEVECPRGFVRGAASAEEAARIEVAEETGLLCDLVEPVGIVCPDTGLLSEKVTVFLASCSRSVWATPEPSEAISHLARIPVADIDSTIARGAIRDSFTLAGVTLARARGFLSVPVRPTR